MTFKWITDWDTIWSDDFVDQWLGWMEASENAHVFFHPAMVKAWVDTYMPIRELHPMFCIATQGDTTIFLPLVIWHKNWKNAFKRTIIPIGYSDFDYHNPIVIGESNLELFWANLPTEIKNNQNINYDIIYTDDMKINIKNSQWCLFKNQECPYILLTQFQDFESYMNSLTKSTRKTLNRSIRSLEEEGELKYHVLDYHEALEALPRLLEVHTARYPNAYKAPDFHKNLITMLMPKELLHFSTITLNKQIISWRIGFLYKDIYYSYMPVFEANYAKFSPSKVHLLMNIEEFIKSDQNVKLYDLMRGAKAYKDSFATNSKKVFSYRLQNTKLISRLKIKLVELKNALKN